MEDPTSIQTETSEMDAQLLASRQQLKESKDRLLTVSDYCETEYLKNRDHIRNAKIALDQTKNYTTQSLASVAYQINTLATTFLSILQMQTAQLNMLETSINQVSQKVDLYQEKVARRDIGKLANKKTSQRGICVRKLMGNEMVMHKDLGIEYAQQVTVRQHKYIRRGIDFNALDNLGQGSYPKMKSLRLHNNANNLTNPMNNMNQLTSTLQRSNQQVHSLQHQQNMMHAQQKQVLMQQQHLMMQQQQRGNSNSQSSGSNYSAMQVQTNNHHNITATSLHSSGSRSSNLQNTRNVGLPEISKTTISDNKNNIPSPPILAPPPPIFQQNNSTPSSGQQPVQQQLSYSERPTQPLQQHTYDEIHNADWEPEVYLQKVVAVYDYNPDQEDELTLKEGDIIYVVVKNEDGWWEGYKSEKVSGLFPSNYVKAAV